MAAPPETSANESKATGMNPLPFLAGLLNALIAVLWFAAAGFGWFVGGLVCLGPGFFAVLAAFACYRRANWWVALGLSVLAANALSVVLLLLAKSDFRGSAGA